MTRHASERAGLPEAVQPPLTELAARFSGPLRSFFRKRSYDHQEAEDLVQEVFYRLAAQAEPVRMGHPEGYIFQMAANLLRDRARRHGTRAAANLTLVARNGSSVEEICPERVLLGKQRLAALREALSQLPDRTRAIFLLHRFEEYKYAEIADSLGISVSSVEKHMMEAIRFISAHVGRD